jgi:hypothetical protein
MRSGSGRLRPPPWRLTVPRFVNAVETVLAGTRPAGAVDLSPVPRSCLIQYRRRLLRRDVDGPIRRPRASGRRLEGGLDGPRSRGTLRRLPPGASNGADFCEKRGSRRPPCQPRPLQGAVFPGQGGSSQRRRKIAEARVPKGNALGRATAPLRLRSRYPRPRRTLAGTAGGAGGIGAGLPLSAALGHPQGSASHKGPRATERGMG